MLNISLYNILFLMLNSLYNALQSERAKNKDAKSEFNQILARCLLSRKINHNDDSIMRT